MFVLLILFGLLSIIVAIVGMSESAGVAIIVLLNGIIEIIAAIRLKRLKSKPTIIEKVVEVPRYIGIPQEPIKEPSAEAYGHDESKKELPRVDNMSGIDFEQFCMRVLGGYGFTNLEQTPASGDHGVDIVAWKGGKKYAIQCKRYSQNVGNKAIQEVYTGKQLYAAAEAVVLTTSRFTSQAIDEAKELGVTLWDRDALKHLMGMANIKDVIL